MSKLIYLLFFSSIIITLCTGTVNAQTSSTCFWADAASFAVLSSQTITDASSSADPTQVTGDIGVYAGTAITGFVEGPGHVSGNTYCASGNTDRNPPRKAMVSANNCYNTLKGLTPDHTFGDVQDLANMTLKPGVYAFPSSAFISASSSTSNGTLVLDDTGNPNAVFVFQITSTLIPATYTKVVMKSGGHDPNVYWQVGSSATISVGDVFEGNIIAKTSIQANTHARVFGRLFALGGSVTLQYNTVTPDYDSDGDGVPDCMDDYPTDSNKAFNSSDSINRATSTIAFEDLWPAYGDFDFNDMVVNYRYNIVTNSSNQVVEVIGHFTLLATGGVLHNGFGVQFPISSSSVGTVISGTQELPQTNAVFILFKDMRQEMKNWNTVPGQDTTGPKSYVLDFKVNNGPQIKDFGINGYNPFLFRTVNGSRIEVHMPGEYPTTLADASVFGTKDDNSNYPNGPHYVSKDGFPWAITIPGESFDYPAETRGIQKAYLHFIEWSKSGGSYFMDWYYNTAADYRNSKLIYKTATP